MGEQLILIQFDTAALRRVLYSKQTCLLKHAACSRPSHTLGAAFIGHPDLRGSPLPSLIYFPTIPPVSPGGGAHCGRGMQPHISDSWPAELGAATARHGSIS